MRIPKDIEKALEKRRVAAEMYNRYDEIIRDFLKENEITDISKTYLGRGKTAMEVPALAEIEIKRAIVAARRD